MKKESSKSSKKPARSRKRRASSGSRGPRSGASSSATLKQRNYVVERLTDAKKSKKDAALAAGFAESTALNAKQKIEDRAAVKELFEAALERQALSADRVLEELRRLAFLDIRELFDEKGNLKSPQQLAGGVGSCIASLEVVKRNLIAGDGEVDQIHKVRVWDKVEALKTLAKHFKLLVERVEVDVKDSELVARLLAGRKRLQHAAETDRRGS